MVNNVSNRNVVVRKTTENLADNAIEYQVKITATEPSTSKDSHIIKMDVLEDTETIFVATQPEQPTYNMELYRIEMTYNADLSLWHPIDNIPRAWKLLGVGKMPL